MSLFKFYYFTINRKCNMNKARQNLRMNEIIRFNSYDGRVRKKRLDPLRAKGHKWSAFESVRVPLKVFLKRFNFFLLRNTVS